VVSWTHLCHFKRHLTRDALPPMFAPPIESSLCYPPSFVANFTAQSSSVRSSSSSLVGSRSKSVLAQGKLQLPLRSGSQLTYVSSGCLSDWESSHHCRVVSGDPSFVDCRVVANYLSSRSSCSIASQLRLSLSLSRPRSSSGFSFAQFHASQLRL
jgi:hypothetical protein